MKFLFLLIFFSQFYVGYSQIENVLENNINFKDIIEKKGLLYFKTDTTLVTGRVIKYNRKKEAKRYAIVENGLPDKSGWIDINNDYDIKYNERITRKPIFDKDLSNDWHSGQNQSNINRKNMNFVIEDKIRFQQNYINSVSTEKDTNYRESPIFKLENNSIKNGLYEEFYDNSKLRRTGHYLNGKKNGNWKEWYENGKMMSSVTYLEGKKAGRLDTYHTNGQLKGRVNYLDGKENGEMMVYNENGEIMIIGFFKEGIQTGNWNYYENGNLIKTENFD